MPLYKPSELRDFLRHHGLAPKKRLSQNFLIDGNILNKIVQLVAPIEGETILEIGPGPGSLTEALLEAGARVIAIEKDTQMAKAHPPHKRLTLYCEDVLKAPLETYLKGKQGVKIAANLPYNLTTPILTRLIPQYPLFSFIAVMVQEEVARRIVATPGTKDYGSLSVFVRFYTEPSYAFKVNRHCFYPAPKVDSAIVAFKLRPPPEGVDPEVFFKMTRTAFGQRRKMLRSSLKILFPVKTLEAALERIGKPSTARPEELTFEDFLRLYTSLLSGEYCNKTPLH